MYSQEYTLEPNSSSSPCILIFIGELQPQQLKDLIPIGNNNLEWSIQKILENGLQIQKIKPQNKNKKNKKFTFHDKLLKLKQFIMLKQYLTKQDIYIIINFLYQNQSTNLKNSFLFYFIHNQLGIKLKQKFVSLMREIDN
ncbi:unnamed protein product [Paramecium octaurelia]|uniref:Uncharacterized protein n=1 Tax=Paramecium octaurelia TaxID=43137 RepID=A0A8S1TAF0_PAROT|nr:unnamed protein product [Paramecium octaurelia]